MSVLWSPQMRKWMKDAHKHGMQLRFARLTKGRRYDGGEGGVPYTNRLTDDLAFRILDSIQARFGNSQRKIDHP